MIDWLVFTIVSVVSNTPFPIDWPLRSAGSRHAAIVYLASTLMFPPWLGPLTLALAVSPPLWILGRRVACPAQWIQVEGILRS